MNTDTQPGDTATEPAPEAADVQDAGVTVEQIVDGVHEQVGERVHADPATVQQLRPETLLMDANVRHDARVDRAFVASIRDHGVLQPIIAVRTDDDRARVRFGHRRTLAAIAAELTTVPVIVHPSVDAADAAEVTEEEIDRIATQTVENSQREGLTHAEQLDAFVSLADLGLTAGQIASRTKTKRRDVAAGLKAARTPEVRDAVVAGLTLEQGAVLDEFTDDPQAYEALLERAHGSGHSWQSFDHLAQRLRDDRDERAATAAVTAELTAAGIRIVEPSYRYDDPTTRLVDLTDEPAPEPAHTAKGETTEGETTEGADPTAGADDDAEWEDEDSGEDEESGEEDPDDVDRRVRAAQAAPDLPAPITPEAHADCPGHAAQVGGYSRRVQAIYVCTDPLRYGHRARSAHRQLRAATAHAPQPGESSEQAAAREETARAEAKAARARVIAGNKAWIAAETVRRDFIAELLTRRTPPKGTAGYVAAVLLANPYALSRAAEKGHELAADLLTGTPAAMGQRGSERIAKVLDGASEPRGHVITLAMTLAAVESTTSKDSWRQERRVGGPDAGLVRYLSFLVTCGYPLAPIERWAIGEDIDADAVFTPATRAASTDTEPAADPDDPHPAADPEPDTAE